MHHYIVLPVLVTYHTSETVDHKSHFKYRIGHVNTAGILFVCFAVNNALLIHIKML